MKLRKAPGAVGSLEPELQEIAGHLGAGERAEMATKLRRWARQLQQSINRPNINPRSRNVLEPRLFEQAGHLNDDDLCSLAGVYERWAMQLRTQAKINRRNRAPVVMSVKLDARLQQKTKRMDCVGLRGLADVFERYTAQLRAKAAVLETESALLNVAPVN